MSEIIPTRRSRRSDPLKPLTHPVRLAVFGGCGIVVVVLLGTLIAHSAGWTAAENAVVDAVNGIGNPVFDVLALGIAAVLGPVGGVIVTVLCAGLVFATTGDVRRAAVFLALVGLTWLGAEAIKHIVRRARPISADLPHHVVTETSFSFPSGHTTFAAALALAFIITYWHSRHRRTILIVAPLGVLLVALSRVYLGVHFPTDVIGAALYSVFAAAVIMPFLVNVAVPLVWRDPGAAPRGTAALATRRAAAGEGESESAGRDETGTTAD